MKESAVKLAIQVMEINERNYSNKYFFEVWSSVK
jgi:hypothetical protein